MSFHEELDKLDKLVDMMNDEEYSRWWKETYRELYKLSHQPTKDDMEKLALGILARILEKHPGITQEDLMEIRDEAARQRKDRSN